MQNIIDYIPIGSENAVSLKFLSTVTGMSTRAVRNAISEVNMSGQGIICNGANHKGYYRPRTYQEAKAYRDYNVSYLISFAAKTKAIGKSMNKLFSDAEQLTIEDYII